MSLRLALLRMSVPLTGRFYRRLYWLPWLAGTLAWYLRPSARRRMTRNLLPVCGSPAIARREAQAACRRAAAYWLDLASMPHRNWETFASTNVRIHNREHLWPIEQPGPVILAGCHSGNPEMAVRALAAHSQREFTALVEPLRPRALSRYMLKLRNAGPGTFLEADVIGGRRAIRVLKAGGTLGLLVDRDIAGNGICTTVCGRRVRIPVGPWELAKRTGAVILPAFAIRTGTDQFEVFLGEPFRVEAGEDPAGTDPLQQAADRWAADFEAHLRRFPGQWTVLEDYWKVHRCGEG